MFIIHWIVSAILIGLTAFLVPGATVGAFSALGAAVVIGLINVFIRPFIILLTLPVNVLTLGLFTLVINGLLIMLASAIVPGFRINGLFTAMIFSLVLTVLNIIMYMFVQPGA
ncbi:MAG: phage holin family protein [bacterium]